MSTKAGKPTPTTRKRKPRAPGRPTKFTKERTDAILAALRAGAYREQAAIANGISPGTLYEWLSQGLADIDAGGARARSAKAEFAEAVSRADAEAEIAALAALRQGMRDRRVGEQMVAGDWRAAQAYLRARAPERWSENRNLEKLMERRLELEERMQERLASAFEVAIAALVAAGVALTAEQRMRAVEAYALGLQQLEGEGDLPVLEASAKPSEVSHG